MSSSKQMFGPASVVALLLLMSAGSSQAAAWSASWNKSNCTLSSGSAFNGTAPNNVYVNSVGNSYSCASNTANTADVVISAFSSKLSSYDGSGSSSSASNYLLDRKNFASTAIADWGGNGFGTLNSFESDKNGPHAADNVQQLDGFLLHFGSGGNDASVALDNISVGWSGASNARTVKKSGETCGTGCQTSTVSGDWGTYNAAKMSVYYYTGSGVPTADLTAANAETLQSKGWTLLGDTASMASNTTTGDLNASDVKSSWWLITAFNGADDAGTGSSWKGGTDAFKLLAFAGNGFTNQQSTPEPASLALVAVASLGAVGMRRRRNKGA